MKKFLSVLFLVFGLFASTGAKFVIDAEKNAQYHNNVGVNYMAERFYYGAIKEFKMAIDLNPNTQATAVYYNNLGRAYMSIGYPSLAMPCFERATIQNPMDFSFYYNLVQSFKYQKVLTKKLAYYSARTSDPMNKITVGLIYIELGQFNKGISVLENFARTESNLLISKAVKHHVAVVKSQL